MNKVLRFKTEVFAVRKKFVNYMKYGNYAPGFAEKIYITPEQVNFYNPEFKRSHSGSVIGGNWDKNLKPLTNIAKYNACFLRWQEGYEWEDTGVYDVMLELIKERGRSVDDCTNIEDIKKRYKRLDLLFSELSSTKKFKSRKQINKNNFKEAGGVFFHIGRDNQIIFSGGGMHRLAMAKILKLKNIPAQLGVVHPEAIDKWQKYKNPVL